MTNAEYEAQERKRALDTIYAVSRGPLADRQEGRKEYALRMGANPYMVHERLEWLIDGTYGHGAQLLALQVLGNKRCNRIWRLSGILGALEFGCPSEWVSQAWRSLTAYQQEAIDRQFQSVIDEWDAQQLNPAITTSNPV